MADAAHPFLCHIERHLGPMQTGASLGNGIQAVRFRDQPHHGAWSFLTLGLSHHGFHQASGADLRLEFILACWERFVERLNPASVLANVCDEVMTTHSAPPRGGVFGPHGPLFDHSEMEALYCSAPVYFDPALDKFDGFPDPFALIWLVPITAAEAAFVRAQGWDAFEDLLEAMDPDLLDMERSHVVPG